MKLFLGLFCLVSLNGISEENCSCNGIKEWVRLKVEMLCILVTSRTVFVLYFNVFLISFAKSILLNWCHSMIKKGFSTNKLHFSLYYSILKLSHIYIFSTFIQYWLCAPSSQNGLCFINVFFVYKTDLYFFSQLFLLMYYINILE